MSEKVGYFVLRLSPYRFILIPIEMACASLECLYKYVIKICGLKQEIM